MYALIVTFCLLNGQCYGNGIEVFASVEQCVLEANNQVAQGIPSDALHCELLVDETVEIAVANNKSSM